MTPFGNYMLVEYLGSADEKVTDSGLIVIEPDEYKPATILAKGVDVPDTLNVGNVVYARVCQYFVVNDEVFLPWEDVVAYE